VSFLFLPSTESNTLTRKLKHKALLFPTRESGTQHCSAASASEALQGGANSRMGHQQKTKSNTSVFDFCFLNEAHLSVY
jgi:hypothetical protein